MGALRNWWECRYRIRLLDSQLVRSGVQRQDPMYPLIREMALIPDRLLRLVLGTGMLVGTAVVVFWIGAADRGVTRLPGSDARSTIYVIDATGTVRWVSCPYEKKLCLEVVNYSLSEGRRP